MLIVVITVLIYIRTIHTLQKSCRASIPRSTNHTSTVHKTLHGMLSSHIRSQMVPYLGWVIGSALHTLHSLYIHN
jgi:hypothetical protein